MHTSFADKRRTNSEDEAEGAFRPMEWYFEHEGDQAGPVTEAEFPRLSREGLLSEDTLVWHVGMEDWMPYREVSDAPRLPMHFPPNFVNPAFVNKGAPRLVEDVPQVDRRYAGFWIRAVALLFDYGVLALARWLLFLPFGIGFIYDPPPGRNAILMTLLVAGLGFFMSLIYHVFFWNVYGATPGKMLLKLKVIAPDGDPPSLLCSIGRYFAQLLSLFTFCIGFLLAGVDSQKRTLHDRLAGTRVIRTTSRE